MGKSLVRCFVVLLVVMFLVAFSSPDEKVNKIFVEAYHLINSAKEAEETSYPDALKLYKDALIKLEDIVSEYPSARLAVEIIQDKAKIGDYSVTEFKTRIVPLAELRAEAEGDLLACALLLATTIDDTEREDNDPLAMIAGRYAEAGQYDRALQIAEGIKRERWKSKAFAKIALGHAEAGQYDIGLQVAKRVKTDPGSPFSADSDLRDLVIKYTEAGRYDLAVQAVGLMKHSVSREMALPVVIDKYIESGQKEGKSEVLSQVLQVAKGIGIRDAFDILIKVAVEYEALGQGQQASKTLSQAHKLARSINISSAHWRASDKAKARGISDKRLGLFLVATKYAEFGQHDLAIEIFGELMSKVDVIVQYIESEQYDKAFQMNESEILGKSSVGADKIAISYAEAGQYDLAIQVLDGVRYNELKVRGLAGVAVVYGKAGQESKESELLSRALQEAGNDTYALTTVAMKYAEVGQRDKVLQMATTIANLTGDGADRKRNALYAISVQCADVGQYDLALQIANLMQDDGAAARLLIEVIDRYDIWEQEEIALKILSQASQALSTASPDRTPSRLSIIAIGYAKARQYSEALQLAEMIEHAAYKTSALAGIIAAYGENGQYDKALQVARTMDDTSQDLGNILLKIALQCIDAGQYDIALQLENTDGIHRRYDVVAGLVAKYLDAGQYDKALQVAEQSEYYGAAADIAEKYAEAGQYDKALHAVEMPSGGRGIRALIAVASGCANSGQTDRASDALFRAIQEIKAEVIEDTRVYRKINILAEAGVECIRSGLLVNSQARKVLHEIVKYSDRRK